MLINYHNKELAFISATQSHENLYSVWAKVQFVTGPRKGKVITCQVPTDIFRYYYHGTTLEVVELDKNDSIISVTDPKADDFKAFGLQLCRVYSFNMQTTDLLASNGFVYNLKQSSYWRDFHQVCDNIISQMYVASNFVMYAYLKDNVLLSLNVEFNLNEHDKRYKYAIHHGFVTADKKLLRMMCPAVANNTKSSNEKLSQEDIDTLIDEMLKKGV